MKVLMTVGKVDGIILVDHKNKKLEVEVLKPFRFEINFPGVLEESFNYLKLEGIMNDHMRLHKPQNLEQITNIIMEKGFFHPIKPGLLIEVRKVQDEQD